MNKHIVELATMGVAVMLTAGGAFAQNYGGATPAAPAPAGPTAETNMFGGPVYNGEPELTTTAALVEAGGGAENFSFSAALVSMLGEKTVNAEVAKLTKQYGKDEVHTFITGMDYAVKDALRLATAAGVTLPAAPADLHGVALANALVTAGTAPDGAWWSGYLFDKTLTHAIHNQVMNNINTKVSVQADRTTHKILNQAMFDVAHALGHKQVKLASLH